MDLNKAYKKIKNKLPDDVKLVAVSKTKTVSDIRKVYNLGHRDFGENKVQELNSKQKELPEDINWHMIGHLQTNKVKYIAPYVSLIHSVDRLKVLKEINKRAKQNNRTINCLLQIHIAEEETKFGLNYQESVELLESEQYKKMQNVKIIGLMGMATFTENTKQIKREFENLRKIFISLKEKYFTDSQLFKELSMGMSADYEIALQYGATMVRVGSLIFGKRE